MKNLFLSICFFVMSSLLVAENASNPLAAVSNIDLRAQYYDLDDAYIKDYNLEGATMLNPKIKLKYELHYWDTDISGENEKHLESALAKLIYFPKEGKFQDMPYRLAVGAEVDFDLGDEDKGTGVGSDVASAFVGIALSITQNITSISLIQHYENFSGNDVSMTALRMITIQKIPSQSWIKYDLKVPYDWENSTIPASFELQLGKSFTRSIGLYAELQGGIGGDKLYNSAAGIGFRYSY